MTDQPDPPLAQCVCGGKAKYLPYSGRLPNHYDVACSDCSANTPTFYTSAEAIAAWNRMQGADDTSLYRAALAQIAEWRHNPNRVEALCAVLLAETGELTDADKAWACAEVARIGMARRGESG